jgi:phospholipid:diacylglycerol acyltransferase
MNVLRRRIVGESSTEPSAEPSREGSPVRKDDHVAQPESAATNPKKRKRGGKRKTAWIFTLGGIFGIAVAAFFVGNNDMLDITALGDLNLESLLEVLPAGLVNDAKELQRHEKDAIAYDSFAIGLAAKEEGITAVHPCIMIPGVISTGLESWSTEEDARPYFRKRLWGSWSMMRALITDKARWSKNIKLDPITGLDPPGVKLRAAQGFAATDVFITGYWLWSKILENLATIGYDGNNAFTAAYDWRMSYINYENRDQYYTRLKNHIELAVRISNKKVVLLSHSMGSQVLYHFLHWVEAEGYGNGGPSWVEVFVDSWINISGCMLGAVKSATAVLSGEMRDTAQLNSFAVYGLEKFLSRAERAEIFRAMPGISSMLPIGGDTIWGNSTWAPDDMPERNVTFGSFLNFRETNSTKRYPNMTVHQTMPFLFDQTESWYKDMVLANYSHGIARTRARVEANQLKPEKWINPLETRLPLAPNLKIYCFYGFGKPTERAYYYRPETDPLSRLNVSIDNGYTNGEVDHGVIMGEGDGTVNLISMGYMCSKGWKMKRYNPAGVQIKVHEMPHEPDRFSPRGGPNTGDHVDILGRSSLNDMILRIAGGKGDVIEEHIASRILEYAERVDIMEEDE